MRIEISDRSGSRNEDDVGSRKKRKREARAATEFNGDDVMQIRKLSGHGTL